MSFIEFFRITQVDDESTRAYLKRLNEKMLKVEELIEFVAYKALINGVKGKALQKELYNNQKNKNQIE